MMDIQQEQGGLVTSRFVQYDRALNRELIDQNWLLLGGDLRSIAADYPERLTQCIGRSK
jgi:hypothetical protein